MGKVVVYNVISLDGYHTGLGNDVTVMFPIMGKVFDTYNAELLRKADLHLVGRRLHILLCLRGRFLKNERAQ